LPPHGLQEGVRVLSLEVAEIASIVGEGGALPPLLYPQTAFNLDELDLVSGSETQALP
jgi:hypothetical protein